MVGGSGCRGASVALMPALAHAMFLSGTLILATGLTALGVFCIVNPMQAALLYGVPSPDAISNAWVAVAGMRDLSMGITTLLLFIFQRSSLRWYVPSLLILPLGDAGLVFRFGGSQADAISHVFGFVCIAVLSMVTWLEDPAQPNCYKNK